MPTLEEMSLDEIEATMAQLRDRRRALKKTGKVAERKITTLANRRERLMERIRQFDAQIEELRREASLVPPVQPRRRGRRPKNASLVTG